MNYDQQFGINQFGGAVIIDFSPPRKPAGRGQAPLPRLVENNLNENQLDPTDGINQSVYVDVNGNKARNPLLTAVDWNGDGDRNDNGVTLNIDTSGSNGRPSACTNASSNSALTGFDDWTNVLINFRPSGDASDGAVNPISEPEPDCKTCFCCR